MHTLQVLSFKKSAVLQIFRCAVDAGCRLVCMLYPKFCVKVYQILVCWCEENHTPEDHFKVCDGVLLIALVNMHHKTRPCSECNTCSTESTARMECTGAPGNVASLHHNLCLTLATISVPYMCYKKEKGT